MRKFLFTVAVVLTAVLCSACEPESVDTTFPDNPQPEAKASVAETISENNICHA